MGKLVSKIKKWCNESRFSVESQDGIDYVVNDFDEIKEEFEGWEKLEESELKATYLKALKDFKNHLLVIYQPNSAIFEDLNNFIDNI